MKNKMGLILQRIFIMLIVVFSLLACVKCIFFGMNIDEEYAVTLAYRILGEDRMFFTMWEPHQMSGFLCALLMKPFLLVSGGSMDYMVIYLRIMGVVLHAGVCTYVYQGLRHICTRYYAFLLSALCFSILPKWILIPEFSNMLLWVILCMMSCLLQIQYGSDFRRRYYVWLGVLTCVGVLAYPSFLLCFVIYMVAIWYLVPARRKTALATYITTCAAIGTGYVTFFASSLGVADFMNGVMQMATDGQHETSFISKVAENALDSVLCLGVYALLYAVAYLVARFRKKEVKAVAFGLICLVSVLWQMSVWLGDSEYLYQDMFLFYHVFLVVLMSLTFSRVQFWVYIMPPVSAVLAAGILTNTGIHVISICLLPAIVYGLACLTKQYRRTTGIVIVALLGLFMFAKGWLVYENGGYKADMLYVKQKALSGPAQNIYCRYLDGYEYNIVQELMDTYVEPGDNVLCVSGHTLWYLLGDVNISNFSTISTPTYDERLQEYYRQFPDKYPDVVIVQEVEGYRNVLELFGLTEPVVECESIAIYNTSRR